ncbi:hypothetical protein RFI_06584 [Reticulomyxa filosa]|uniref:Uncharacterized protein n=1 Tax=Reticulomyxa filosa TaxID=46433 RepID=X6NXJ0_RETFI|nr:hypothetical protein RFI_06584 [Reticulomyxa filosa]|eukprot:ETO30539.1 hypothetical protein RFI_06584 [Reticulomyxa filosa]
MQDYDNAKKYAFKLINIVTTLNKNDFITPEKTKMFKELNARIFHISCLFQLVSSQPQLSGYAEEELQSLFRDANTVFGLQSVRLISFHVSLGKLFAGLLRFERVTPHFNAVENIRIRSCNKANRRKIGEMLMELVEACLIQIQNNRRTISISHFSTSNEVDYLYKFVKELLSTERDLSNEFEESPAKQSFRQNRQVVISSLFNGGCCVW